MDITKLALPVGAALASGAATTYIAPMVAEKIVDLKDPKNWYAVPAVAGVAGAALMAAGAMLVSREAASGSDHTASTALLYAGAAMAGAGAAWTAKHYLSEAQRSIVPGMVGARMHHAPMHHHAAGNLAMGNLNVQAAFPGLTPTQRYYAQRGGMPVASRG
jgi:hypothetical protein